jgi:hypothetical protein
MLKRTTIFWLILTILLAACSGPQVSFGIQNVTRVFPEPSPPGVATLGAYPVPATPRGAQPYPGQTVYPPEPTLDPTLAESTYRTAIAASTATTAARFQTATAVEAARPISGSVATSTPPLAPTITTSNSIPDCVPGRIYTHCRDVVLAIDFDYPFEWGTISAGYTNGGYAGYAYEYHFSVNSISDHQAGGRSRDYSEGRGAVVTDFRGYDSGPAALDSLCKSYNALLCRYAQPGVSLVLPVQLSGGMFPSTAYYCDMAQQMVYSPAAMVAINLPRNAQINGFVFVSRILSDQAWLELAGTLGITDTTQDIECQSAAVRAQYNARLKSLLAKMQAGTADAGTQLKFNQLMHLAQSIHFD